MKCHRNVIYYSDSKTLWSIRNAHVQKKFGYQGHMYRTNPTVFRRLKLAANRSVFTYSIFSSFAFIRLRVRSHFTFSAHRHTCYLTSASFIAYLFPYRHISHDWPPGWGTGPLAPKYPDGHTIRETGSLPPGGQRTRGRMGASQSTYRLRHTG